MPIISLLSSSYFIQFKFDQNNQNIDSSYHKKNLEPMLVTLFVNILCFTPLYFSGYKLFVLAGQAIFISLGTLYFIIYLFLLCFFHEQNLNKKIM